MPAGAYRPETYLNDGDLIERAAALSQADRWALADDDTGNRVTLRPGRTWVALARLGEGVLLGPDRIAELVG